MKELKYDHIEGHRLLAAAIEQASFLFTTLGLLKSPRVNFLLGSVVKQLGVCATDGPPMTSDGKIAMGVALEAVNKVTELVMEAGDDSLTSLGWIEHAMLLERRIRAVVDLIVSAKEDNLETTTN